MSNQRRHRTPEERTGKERFRSRGRYHAACDSVDEKFIFEDNLDRFSPDELDKYTRLIWRQFQYAKNCYERRTNHRNDFFNPD